MNTNTTRTARRHTTSEQQKHDDLLLYLDSLRGCEDLHARHDEIDAYLASLLPDEDDCWATLRRDGCLKGRKVA
ncbi:MAG: hypothetical protein JW910_05765 [Anaerolineae bacterium]|nr:hypothetical protein [Anaerolineae bacterium]